MQVHGRVGVAARGSAPAARRFPLP